MLLWRNWQTRLIQTQLPSGVGVRLPPGVPWFFGVVGMARWREDPEASVRI